MSERLLGMINHDWQAFLDSFDGLSESSLVQHGVIGTWSVQDIMGHITTWEEEVIEFLPLISAGKPTPSYDRYGGVDTFNEQKITEKRVPTLRQIKRNLKITHQRLLRRLSEIPDGAITPRFEQRFGEDTWYHYRQHAEQIQIWRKRQP